MFPSASGPYVGSRRDLRTEQPPPLLVLPESFELGKTVEGELPSGVIIYTYVFFQC